MTRDDRLRDELEALESSAPRAEPPRAMPSPGLGTLHRPKWTWVAAAAVPTVLVAAVIVVGLAGLLRDQLPAGGHGPMTPIPTGPVAAEVREGDFVLRISSPRATWSTDEPIDLSASLSYEGQLNRIDMWGPSSGPIEFSVFELNGDRAMRADWELRCAKHTVAPDTPFLKPYSKSGSFSAGDPHEAFYRDFFAEPAFQLPAGGWEVTAHARFALGDDCSGELIEMQVSLVLDVVAPTSSDPPIAVAPVSLSHPTLEAEKAIEACRVRERADAAVGMGQLPASDLPRYLPFTGREPELQSDTPVWVVAFEWDLADAPFLPTRGISFRVKTDHLACVVLDGNPVHFALGVTADEKGDLLSTPVPVTPGPDLTLPPLAD
jgi:hypothetical protein